MHFSKERYTPFSTFRGTFALHSAIGEIFDVELCVNGLLIHKGVVDFSETKLLPAHRVLTVSSRGYSFALGYNELPAGLQYGVTLASLMAQVPVPNVTFEAVTTPANFLYIKPHASLWDAVVNLCLKVNSTQPYIAYPNVIRFTKHANSKLVSFSSADRIGSLSDGNDLSTVISHIHMKDTNDSYNTYNATSQFATDRSIVRHKYIDLDRQWLDSPTKALTFRLNYAMRGSLFSTLTYRGFSGEDINDRFSVSADGITAPAKYISKLEIFGNKNGVFTRLTAYKDAYCN